MKNVVRALALVLAVTGFTATTQISSAASHAKNRSSMMSAYPKPMCPPSDPHGCGMIR